MFASLYQTLFDKQILNRVSENVKICDNFFTAHFLTTWRKFIQGYFLKCPCSLFAFRYTRRIFIREEKMETKEIAIPKTKLLNEISKDLSNGMTVKDAKLIMEIMGIAKNYTWKENKLGNLQAFVK